jgi:hypothetical protein
MRHTHTFRHPGRTWGPIQRGDEVRIGVLLLGVGRNKDRRIVGKCLIVVRPHVHKAADADPP